MIDFSQKTILITGASKGIGRATAQLFAKEGATVLFTSRSDKGFAALEQELKSLGAKDAKGYSLDVKNLTECQSTIQKIKSDFGKLDILVNNAGIGIFANMKDMTPDQWKDVIDTNLNGVYYLTHSALPLMIESGAGHIVNVASLASRNTFPGGSAYCASKFGLLGLSECLMLDVREDNIKVSIIMPGSVNTEFNNHPVDSDEETWKLTSNDVAEAIFDVVNTRTGHLMSRVELRPSNPAKKK